MNYGKSEELLRALIRSDAAAFERFNNELRVEKWPDAGRHLTATFYMAVLRRFHEGQPVQDIIDYVSQLRSRLPVTDELDPHVAELMIRLIVHNGISVGDLPPSKRVHAQHVVIYDILSSEHLSDPQLDNFFAEVDRFLLDNTPPQ